MGTVIYNSKLDSIKPYEVDKTKYSIKLDANESFISFPKELQEQLCNIMTNLDFNRYPDASSEEICRLYAEYCGVEPKKVMAGNGSDELIQILTNAFVGKGDKILTPKPDFSMYKFYTSVMEGSVIEFPLDEELKLDVEKFIETANKEEVRVIIFSNPCNPTGGIIPREAIIKIVESCNALVVVDEAYYDFYGESVVDSIDTYENLAVLRTTSKAMGLAAMRMGFLIANEKLIYNIRKVKPPFNINSLTQAVGALILSNPQISKENVERILEERSFLVEELQSIQSAVSKESFKIHPTKANFVYIKATDAEAIYSKLLQEDIIIRCFGNGAIRITVGSRNENIAVITALRKVMGI